MFGPLGVPELIFILVLALLIFGPKRLPEIGRTLGKGMSEFRKASNDLKRTINTELALDESPAPPSSPAAAASAGTTRRLPGLEQPAEPPPAELETPAFRMPQGPPPEVEARSASARPLPPEWTQPPESPEPASTAEPLEPR